MSVLSHLEATASKLVLSTTETSSINTSISNLKGKLTNHFKTLVTEQIQFGSSTRGTILPRKYDSHSDIDYMVVFNNSENYKPATFIERLNKFAKDNYPNSEIYRSHPTVVLELNHIMFELVPAYKGWFSTYIPAPASDYTDWIVTDPNGFNGKLTSANGANSNNIKPLIRLIKYWNAQNDYVFNSYELEQTIVNGSYFWCTNLKEYFFKAIEDFSTWNLPEYKAAKVRKAKEIVTETKKLEADGYPSLAESEVKKLIP